jgi:hypothetical protein
MRIRSLWAAWPLALASAATAIAAQPCIRPQPIHQGSHKAGEDCEAAFWDNMMWPNQYVGPSRRGICQSFDLMINNGWRRHNLLGAHHFDRNSSELTESGRLKVQWILTQAPANHRTIYIERTSDQEQSAERLESVQQLASSLSTGAAAEVRETHIRDFGRPASAVDAVFTGFSANQMIPMLPPSTTGGGSAGVSAGGGG